VLLLPKKFIQLEDLICYYESKGREEDLICYYESKGREEDLTDWGVSIYLLE
jgi:hypothetical protein